MQNLGDNLIKEIPVQKLKYERQNLINWKKGKYVIWKFPMKLEPTNNKTPDDEMTFKQIEESDHMKNLES